MGSVSDSESDGSMMYSQPASPISLSTDDSRLFNDSDDIPHLPGAGLNGAVYERRPPRPSPDNDPSRGKNDFNAKFLVSQTFDLSRFDVDAPFQYDALFAAAFIPTFCLALGFVGESFLFACGVGVGVARLLLDAGYETRAFCVAVLTFFLLQFSLLFSALPLIWTSLANFFLLLLFNSFAVLSASWTFLHFRCFRRFDAELTIVLEKILFAAFPAVCLTIQSWMFVLFVGTPAYLPYFLLVVGFVYAQLFLVIRPSSFWRRESVCDPADDHSAAASLPPLVLPAEVVLIASGFHAFIPAVCFLCVHSSSGPFLEWSFYLRFCFLLSIGIFSSSLFVSVNDILSYLTFLDLTSRNVRTVKLISGGNSLLCGYLWTVNALSATSSGAWLPWLPLFACAHVGIGAAAATSKSGADRRHAVKLSLAAVGVFCFAYAAFFFQFPLLRRVRGLAFHFGALRVSIFSFVVLLFLLSVAGAAIVVQPLFVLRRHLHPAIASLVLVIHAALFHFAEMLLFLYDAYPFAGVLVSAALFALLYYRMYRVDAATPSSYTAIGIWVGVCLALSKLYFASLIHWDSVIGDESFLHFFLVFLVIAGASGIAVLADKFKTAWRSQRGAPPLIDRRLLLVPALVLQFAAHFLFVRPLWTRWFEVETMTFGDALSVHMLLTGIFIKALFPEVLSVEEYLSPVSSSSFSNISLSSLYAFWFSLSAAVFFLQPNLAFTADNFESWIRLTGIFAFSHLTFLGDSVSHDRLRPRSWLLYAYGIGLPVAMETMRFVGVDIGLNLRTFLYVSTFVVVVGQALGSLWPLLAAPAGVSDNNESGAGAASPPKTVDQHRRLFHETVAPRMQLTLLGLTLFTAIFEWTTLPSAPRRWNDVDLFVQGCPPFLRLASLIFPGLTILSKLDHSKDLTSENSSIGLHPRQLRRGSVSRLLITAFNASTLSNVLVVFSFLLLTSCLSWRTLHPTTRHLFFLLISLHFAFLRADPLLLSPSNSCGLKTDRPSFFVVLSLLFYCGILQIAAISASRFWRSTAGAVESTLHLIEILLCVTLVPCATLTAAQIGADGLFPAHFLTSLPPASFTFATFPCALLLFVISTSGVARIVAGLELVFSFLLLSSHIIIE